MNILNPWLSASSACGLLWRWRAGPHESPSRWNGSGRAGIGWEFGRSPQRDRTRPEKTKDWAIVTSCRLSGWMCYRKFGVDSFTKTAVVAHRGWRIQAARMTQKNRRANFLDRVWSLAKTQQGILVFSFFFLSFFLSGGVEKRRAIMPRRTVQEVTVQDVQKRRNPNKHYVSCI